MFWSLLGDEIEEDKRVTTDYEGKSTRIHERTLDVRANMDYHSSCIVHLLYFGVTVLPVQSNSV